MKKIMISGFVGAGLLAGILLASPIVTEEELGLRKVDLYSEDTVKPDETKYGTKAAGSSKKIERAY